MTIGKWFMASAAVLALASCGGKGKKSGAHKAADTTQTASITTAAATPSAKPETIRVTGKLERLEIVPEDDTTISIKMDIWDPTTGTIVTRTGLVVPSENLGDPGTSSYYIPMHSKQNAPHLTDTSRSILYDFDRNTIYTVTPGDKLQRRLKRLDISLQDMGDRLEEEIHDLEQNRKGLSLPYKQYNTDQTELNVGKGINVILKNN